MFNFKVKKFFNNWIISEDVKDKFRIDSYYLWKDGSIHENNLGLGKVCEDRGFGDRFKAFGEQNYSLAPGYYATEQQAKVFLHAWSLYFEECLSDLKDKIADDIKSGKVYTPKRAMQLITHGVLPAGTTFEIVCGIPILDKHSVIITEPAKEDNDGDWEDIEPMTAQDIKDEFNIDLTKDGDCMDIDDDWDEYEYDYDEDDSDDDLDNETIPESCKDCKSLYVCWDNIVF